MVGMTIGVLISPLMWLQFYSPDPLVRANINPLCPDLTKRVLDKAGSTQVFNLSGANKDDKLSHNITKLSHFELQRSIPTSSDPTVRKKHLFQELAVRKLLFVGVITAKKYLDTRALGIWRTWGREVSDLHFFSAQPDSQDLNLPVITLPGINDTQYPPQRKVYRMLKYMHDHFIDEFDFFMRSDDDVYVKTDRLMELLQNINPAQDIYMGCPGFGRPDDQARIKLKENEHYCMGGPGVIFSRSALRKLAPHLEDCLKSVVVSYNEDVEVGRCVSEKLQLQCTWSWETSVLFWTDYKKIIPTKELYSSSSVRKAITLHPLKDPRLMYRMHQYAQQLRLDRVMKTAASVQNEIERITDLVPRDMSHYDAKKWLWYDMGTNPKSRYEIAIWEYFNSTRHFLAFEHMPVVGLPSALKTGINLALEVLLDIMNEREDSTHPFIPPYHLYDGFTTLDHSSGVQYSLHMSVNRKGITASQEYVATVFVPFQGAGMAMYEKSEPRFSPTVHIIVNVAQTTDLTEFLRMYEMVCLESKLQTHLHLVIFGKNSLASSLVQQLKSSHPGSDLTTYENTRTNFSHTSGYQLVSERLQSDDLLLLFDSSFVFTSEFINHCHMNTVQGKQAYFPILFSFYKPELVQKTQQRAPQMLISSDSGFFLRYNYQVVSIYKSDYVTISQAVSSVGSKSHLNEDVQFLDKALASDVYVMRALEPYLRRWYRPRTCKGLSGNTRLACLNSRADTIGSKKILGSILASHDLLDSI